MKKQQGFTLIELMIVVAIIAILAAIAISQYQDYVIRSQVSEGSSLADGTKTAVAEFYNNTGHFGASNISLGLSTNTSIVGKYVAQVDASGGPIVVTFNTTGAHTNIQGGTLVFSPIAHAGSIEWTCNGGAGTDIENQVPSDPLPRLTVTAGRSTRRAAQAALLFCEGGHTPEGRYGTVLASYLFRHLTHSCPGGPA